MRLPGLGGWWRRRRPAAAVDAGPLHRRAAALRALGLEEPLLFLSFDCDTDLDIDVAEQLVAALRERGIASTWAVPGRQLERGAEVWRAVARAGGEFMNHGGLPHAELRDGEWVGITFYDGMDDAAVVADIRRGHAIVTEVIGEAPRGFRAPHFGCYQAPAQVARLHGTARDLGCRYASTTAPAWGEVHGPVVRVDGLLEFPCTGSARHPGTLLDSWTYLTDRRHYALGDTYGELFVETLDVVAAERIPALFVWYADPAHVHGQASFMRAMDAVATRGLRSVTGEALCARFAPRAGA